MASRRYFYYVLFLFCFLSVACSPENDTPEPEPTTTVPDPEESDTDDDDTDTTDDTDDTDNTDDTEDEDTEDEDTSGFAEIDFSNWKLTLPVDNDGNGRPDEYQPSSLSNYGYQDIAAIRPYMYDDETDASLVFHTEPATSTSNSSYSRSELRELINPSSSRENWSLQDGGFMQGTLKMEDISEDNNSSREFHRTIFMQIHGIISIEDMNRLGLSSNNGPPLVKMYWEEGNIWIFKKSLENESTSGDDLYDEDNYEDEKINMGYVGFEEFTLSIRASDAKLEIQLNEEAPVVYEDVSLEKWPFENYYKAGNYLQSTSSDAFATLKYYDLTVSH